MSHTIFFDCETGGLEPKNPTIQIAAIAIDDSDWSEEAVFQCKIQFKESDCEPEALKLNRYDPDVWKKEAVSKASVACRLNEFSKPYRSVQMLSKRTGEPYSVAKLCGHNALLFDLPRLRELYAGAFFPFVYHVKDTLQRALWFYDEHPDLPRPESLKLGVLCAAFGISTDGAHDALTDVRLTVALARAIKEAEHDTPRS